MGILKSIPGDIRGAIIGLVLGWLANWSSGYFWPDELSTYAVPVNINGYAQPLPGLLRNAGRENPSMTYRTEPEDLTKAWVCEAASMRGENAHQLLVQYSELYKDCFSLDQKSKTEFVIRPNTHSGEMLHSARGWFCKCSDTK